MTFHSYLSPPLFPLTSPPPGRFRPSINRYRLPLSCPTLEPQFNLREDSDYDHTCCSCPRKSKEGCRVRPITKTVCLSGMSSCYTRGDIEADIGHLCAMLAY